MICKHAVSVLLRSDWESVEMNHRPSSSSATGREKEPWTICLFICLTQKINRSIYYPGVWMSIHGCHVFPFRELLFVQNSLFVWIVSSHQMLQCPKISLSMEYFPKDADSSTRKQMSPPSALRVPVEMEELGNRRLFSTSRTRTPGIQLGPTNLTEKLDKLVGNKSEDQS